MTGRCTCAGIAPGYGQHEAWCGKEEVEDDPVTAVVNAARKVVNAPGVRWHPAIEELNAAIETLDLDRIDPCRGAA